MADLDESNMIKLAGELVMNIRNYKLVFADYGIDENDYYELEKNAFFKRAKEMFALEWNSINSTADRVRIKSLAGYEHMMPTLIRRAIAEDTPLAAAASVASTLAKTSGLGTDNKTAGNASERFIIQINLGADVETFNKSIEINPHDVDLGKIGDVKAIPMEK